MRQQSFSKSKDKKDDGLKPLTRINQRLTADHVFAKKSATRRFSAKSSEVDEIEEYCSLGVRDEYSGFGVMTPNS